MTPEEADFFADALERIEALLIEIRDDVQDMALAPDPEMPDLSGLESDVGDILELLRPRPKRKPRSAK